MFVCMYTKLWQLFYAANIFTRCQVVVFTPLRENPKGLAKSVTFIKSMYHVTQKGKIWLTGKMIKWPKKVYANDLTFIQPIVSVQMCYSMDHLCFMHLEGCYDGDTQTGQ